MALAPEVASFGDGSHQPGETGLTITGGGFGAFPGSAWIYQNADRTGLSDQLTIGAWNDIELTGVDIPASPNNSPGTVYLFVEREDLAWSQGFAFTLNALGINGSLSQSIGTIGLSAAATVLVAGSVSQSLGAIASAASGTVLVQGSLSASIDEVSLAATGTLGNTITGALNLSVGQISLSALGGILLQGVLNEGIGEITLSAYSSSIIPPRARTIYVRPRL